MNIAYATVFVFLVGCLWGFVIGWLFCMLFARKLERRDLAKILATADEPQIPEAPLRTCDYDVKTNAWWVYRDERRGVSAVQEAGPYRSAGLALQAMWALNDGRPLP